MQRNQSGTRAVAYGQHVCVPKDVCTSDSVTGSFDSEIASSYRRQ